MLRNTFIISLIAQGFAAAVDNADNIEVYTELEFTSGFVIPANISVEDYDDNTHLMVPVASLSKRDSWDLELTDLSLADEFFSEVQVDDDQSVSKRQSQKTNILVGRTQVDYGCDASIRKTLTEAIHSLCRNGLCDGGSQYTRKVKHLNGKPFNDAWVQVRIEGHYDGTHTRGYIANVVENLVTPDTALPAWREYHHQSQHNYYTHACWMSKFGNYIAIHKRFSPNPVDLRMYISLHVSNQRCIGQQIFKEALGAVNGYAAAFFNTFVPDCA